MIVGNLFSLLFFFCAHKLLVNHNITTIQIHDLEECKWRCYQEPNCVSVNIHTHKNYKGLYRCELNNATHLTHGLELLDAVDYFYYRADSACDKEDHCANGSVCQSGYTDKGYRCVYPPGWKFAHCQQDIDECVPPMHNCCKDAACNNTKGSYTCSCKFKPGYFGDDGYNCTEEQKVQGKDEGNYDDDDDVDDDDDDDDDEYKRQR